MSEPQPTKSSTIQLSTRELQLLVEFAKIKGLKSAGEALHQLIDGIEHWLKARNSSVNELSRPADLDDPEFEIDY